MAKVSKSPTVLQLADAGAIALAVWFTYSVIRNAHDLILSSIKNAPASYALILALGLIAYTWYKRRKFSAASLIALTILGTSTAIWLLGLSV
jgi:hypothetical protein